MVSKIFLFLIFNRRNIPVGGNTNLGIQYINAYKKLRNNIFLSEDSYDDFQDNFNVLKDVVQFWSPVKLLIASISSYCYVHYVVHQRLYRLQNKQVLQPEVRHSIICTGKLRCHVNIRDTFIF